MADEFLRRRLRDLEQLETTLEAFSKYLEPLKDKKTQKILLDKKTGLPKFALEIPSMDKFITAYLKMHERVMLLRGEATTRTEALKPAIGAGGDAPLNENLRPPSTISPRLSQQDARAMARAVLEGREPSLGGTPEAEVIDAPVEATENAADDSNDSP